MCLMLSDRQIGLLTTGADRVSSAQKLHKLQPSSSADRRQMSQVSKHRKHASTNRKSARASTLQVLHAVKMATIESVVEGNSREADKPIDREKTCPLLLRVFCSMGRHHSLMEYARGNTPTNELQIYTWMDATLKELTSLVKEVNPDARRKGTFFDFAIVYPDPRSPTYRLRDIGTTCAGRKTADDTVTLASKKFNIGDYLDIAIAPPRGGAPPGPPMRRAGRPY